MKLEGATVLVTGGAVNIGRAVSLGFSRAGARVVVNTRSNVEAGNQLVADIKAGGGEAIFVQADVTQPEEVNALFHQAETTFGGVDVLVNNAGAARPTPFTDSSKADWQAVFDVNFFSAVVCSQRAAEVMGRRGGGKIINTASVRGLDHTGREGVMAYSAAKAALINFTKTLAKELAPDINVNAVAPGFVLTSPYDNVPEEVKRRFIESTSIKRWISTEELAETYVYLAGQDAVTGTVVTVDGGFTLKQG